MNVKLEESNGIAVCAIEGDINSSTSPELRKHFDEVIGKKISNIVIDMNQVGYIDSSGIATFVEGLKKFKASGGKFKLLSLQEKVKSVFEITKLDKLFEIYSDKESAISSF